MPYKHTKATHMDSYKAILLLLAAVPAAVSAQTDDMYFTPKKADKAAEAEAGPAGEDGWRDVDDYNRRGEYRYRATIGKDSTGQDVIHFDYSYGGDGEAAYSDTIHMGGTPADSAWSYGYGSIDSEDGWGEAYGEGYGDGWSDSEDYYYTRRMGMFDDFYGWPYPYSYGWGYAPYGWRTGWGWPYYGGAWAWHRPWGYYSAWGGYGWGYSPGYWWGYPSWHRSYARSGGVSGTSNHGRVSRYGTGSSGGVRFGSRAAASRSADGTHTVGSARFGSRAASAGTRTSGTYRGGASSGTAARPRATFGGSRSYGSPSAGSSSTRSGATTGGSSTARFGSRATSKAASSKSSTGGYKPTYTPSPS